MDDRIRIRSNMGQRRGSHTPTGQRRPCKCMNKSENEGNCEIQYVDVTDVVPAA